MPHVAEIMRRYSVTMDTEFSPQWDNVHRCHGSKSAIIFLSKQKSSLKHLLTQRHYLC